MNFDQRHRTLLAASLTSEAFHIMLAPAHRVFQEPMIFPSQRDDFPRCGTSPALAGSAKLPRKPEDCRDRGFNSQGPPMIVCFGECELDLDRRELRQGARAVHVWPQVFGLLAHLIAKRDRVVSRDEIIEAVWRGRIVSEATLSSRINAARQAVGDTGKTQAVIR